MIDISKRGLLLGLGASLITAPSIVRPASLMRIKRVNLEYANSIRMLWNMPRKQLISTIYDSFGNEVQNTLVNVQDVYESYFDESFNAVADDVAFYDLPKPLIVEKFVHVVHTDAGVAIREQPTPGGPCNLPEGPLLCKVVSPVIKIS